MLLYTFGSYQLDPEIMGAKFLNFKPFFTMKNSKSLLILAIISLILLSIVSSVKCQDFKSWCDSLQVIYKVPVGTEYNNIKLAKMMGYENMTLWQIYTQRNVRMSDSEFITPNDITVDSTVYQHNTIVKPIVLVDYGDILYNYTEVQENGFYNKTRNLFTPFSSVIPFECSMKLLGIYQHKTKGKTEVWVVGNTTRNPKLFKEFYTPKSYPKRGRELSSQGKDVGLLGSLIFSVKRVFGWHPCKH